MNTDMNLDEYYRMLAYLPNEDLTVILDTYGKFNKLWQFSVYMRELGFEIIEVSRGSNLIQCNFTNTCTNTKSNKIYLRGLAQGKPEISDVEWQDRKCHAYAVGPCYIYAAYLPD